MVAGGQRGNEGEVCALNAAEAIGLWWTSIVEKMMSSCEQRRLKLFRSVNDYCTDIAEMAAPLIKVYYWPMLARGAPLIRMLEHTGTPYEFVGPEKFAEVGSFKGAQGDTFAVPIVADGDFAISQSTACSLYLGHKTGLDAKCTGFNQFKASQYMADIVDTFEVGLGRQNEAGPTLKKFIEGGRFASLMGNIERGIKGPYYFGEAPCCVDFFLAATLDWRTKQVFGPLLEKLGVDAMAP